MRRVKISIMMGTAAVAGMLAAGSAQAQSPADAFGAAAAVAAGVVAAPYFWGGHNYCWYDGGWQGPGWYWCGYADRRGFGWGGREGFRGWHRGGPHGGKGGPHPHKK